MQFFYWEVRIACRVLGAGINLRDGVLVLTRGFLPFSLMQRTAVRSLCGPLLLRVAQCHRESPGVLRRPASPLTPAMNVAVGLPGMMLSRHRISNLSPSPG